MNKADAVKIKEVGCCGAFCGTCRAREPEGICRGCKLGYDDGGRDIHRARCKIKACCFRDRGLETCADCPNYNSCTLIMDFHGKKGFKYEKYRQSIEFIRENGYQKFLEKTGGWSGAYGRLS